MPTPDLSNRRILLGICSGIAAYKTPILVRALRAAGAEVEIVLSGNAQRFVAPTALQAVSGRPVRQDLWDEAAEASMGHIELARWADTVIVAPATANTMSKMASGNSDNLLLAIYLSAKCPVYVAPAMDLDMYRHASSKTSMSTLQSYGNIIIPAEVGELASGLIGAGRMAEPATIVKFIESHILEGLPLYQKKILITAGPTYEAIDPVRFIGNHSSGKMGFEIAKAASNLGAEVLLISGPTHQKISSNLTTVIPIVSAKDMYEQVHQFFESCDVAILSAAVADYKPKVISSQKIKKEDHTLTLELEKTQDILASLGKLKKNQLLVGFALETDNEIPNAIKKLKNKNLDLIVLNSLSDKGAGFGTNTNKVTLIKRDLSTTNLSAYLTK